MGKMGMVGVGGGVGGVCWGFDGGGEGRWMWVDVGFYVGIYHVLRMEEKGPLQYRPF